MSTMATLGASAGGVAIKFGEIIAKALVEKGVEKLLEPKLVKKINQKLSVRMAVDIRSNDVHEKIVYKEMETLFKEFNINKNIKLDIPSISYNGVECAIKLSLYGSIDELPTEYFENHFDIPYKNEIEAIPTISSISIFLYPLNLPDLDSILLGYNLLEKMGSFIQNKIENKGVNKYIIFITDKSQSDKLIKNIRSYVDEKEMLITDFIFGPYSGLQLINMTSLDLKYLIDGLNVEYGGVINKIFKRVKKVDNTL